MKNFLAIDTASEYLSVVAVVDGNTYSRYLPDCAMRHSTALMTEIDGLLKEHALSLADFHFFACVVGAGSFTGIRIGLATVKGLALATGKPTLPITSFDVMAYNGVDGERKKTLCLVDALHGNYYAAGYDGHGCVLFPCYLDEGQVNALRDDGYRLRAHRALPLIGVEDIEIVSPVTGLELAVKTLSEDRENFGELTALYVRKSSAELNLENNK